MSEPFHWQCHPKAEAFVLEIVEHATHLNPFIEQLNLHLLQQTSTRLFDWVDHVVSGYSPLIENQLNEAGFTAEFAAPTYRVFSHPGAQLPRVILKDQEQEGIGIALKVENIADFLMVHTISGWIEGSPYSGFRRCLISTQNHCKLWVVERRGTLTMEPTYPPETDQINYIDAVEKWQSRPRVLDDENQAMQRALLLAEEIVELVGRDLAAWIVLEVERKYWQLKNTAGQIQKNRQDRLGFGWANHDHHTFRSSRERFHSLVRLFEILGFHCRERFYAGQEAGWGAQVMENSRCGLVLFLDVDLSAEELEFDFSHHPLLPKKHLGTVGLWCALHGDSILQSGMHHLEAQFMFDQLAHDLNSQGIKMMDPFSSFPYLRQAFTAGERWHVNPHRIQRLVEEGKISHEEADKFSKEGAIGSHLENLQRREGYKGFNQKNVSYIIKKTDPRTIQL
ncbi:hypothetical protein [Parachlamydia acanthamoebae]|jgi:hypothetical protein|uniref:hypothetical protein n=1 Tax=Parachlamydia acanthamoebae TaxID=83552 RepID=UPI0024E245D6|nr:hypothetical protein [Parachlamydia acanthamoebae]